MRLNDLELNFTDRGEGLPIVLLHGLALDNRIWNHVIETYASQARFISPDLRGHGKTSLGQADATLGQIADDLLAFMNALNLSKVCLLGHSMGGYIALEFAARYPQRLSSLVLLTSNVRADAPEKKKGRLEDAQKVLNGGVPAFAASMASRLTKNAALADQLRAEMEGMNPAGLSNILIAIANRLDQQALLPKLKVPVLAIAGAEDQISSVTLGLEAANLAKHGHKLLLPGVGHMPMLENPLAFGAALLSFQEYIHEFSA
jgi:pimeloyl-ACP methyl ester carboxylesterase